MLPDSALHQALLVVYAVIWGGTTATFARLRVFAINELFTARAPARREQIRRRLSHGLVIGNVAPVATLAGLIALSPEVQGFWGIAAGGFLGLTATAFPRILHASTASNEQIKRHYAEWEAKVVLAEWDRAWWGHTLVDHWQSYWREPVEFAGAGANSRRAHVRTALLMLISPSVAAFFLFAASFGAR